MKKFKVKTAKIELHKLWSLKVREGQGFACQWCKNDGKLNINPKHHAHHIVAVSICGNAGRFEIENGMCLCFRCHLDRLKADVDAYKDFRDKWLFEKAIDYFALKRKYNEKVKFTKELYDQKLDELK